MSTGEQGPDSGGWAEETLAADGTQADGEVSVRPPASHLERGQQLGRYLVVERLGAGAMGVVYAAYDPELDRKVAVKLLLGDAKGEAQTRLRREAQALARLSHPGVVAVHDVGEVDGRVFVAMEFVAGTSLREWLAEGGRPWTEVRDVFVQAAYGLAAAHEEQVIHRDFKPDNVLLSEKGQVRVADFGLAMELEHIGPSESVVATVESHGGEPQVAQAERWADLTASGTVMGTPVYLAPEQWQGKPATAKSDQFSFCVSLFEALHGMRPFEADSIGELAAAILAGKIPATSADGVPGWLDRAVRRGLSVRPGDRFDDMRELITVLERDPKTLRRRLMGGAFGVAALMVAIGVGRAVAPPGENCSQAGAPMDATWNAEQAASLRAAFEGTGSSFAASAADGVVEQLDRYAEQWRASSQETCDRFLVEHQDSARLHDLRRACLDRGHSELTALIELLLQPDAELVGESQVAARSLGDLGRCSDTMTLVETGVEPPPAEAREAVLAMRHRLDAAKTRIRAGKYAGALERAEAAMAKVSDIGYAPVEAEAALVLGEARYWTGDYDGAAASLREAIELGARWGDSETEAAAWTWLVWVVGYAQHRLEPGLEIAHAAENAIMRAGDQPSLKADLLDYKGMILLEADDLEAAEPLLSGALTLRETIHGELDHRVIWSLNNLSVLAAQRGDHARAIELQMRALPMRVQLHGPAHPDVGFAHKNLGTYHRGAGDLERALKHDLDAVSLFEAGFGAQHPQTIEARAQLAGAYRDLGEIGLARRTFDQTLASARAIRHPRTAAFERERAALDDPR